MGVIPSTGPVRLGMIADDPPSGKTVWIIQVDGVVQLKPLAVKIGPLVVKKVHGKLYPVMSE